MNAELERAMRERLAVVEPKTKRLWAELQKAEDEFNEAQKKAGIDAKRNAWSEMYQECGWLKKQLGVE